MAPAAGATGIAITLATREDKEAIAGIEKLLGSPIPKLGAAAEAEPRREPEGKPEKAVEAERPHPRERRGRDGNAERPKRSDKPRSEPKAEQPERKPEPKAERPKRSEKPKEPAEADSGWNGPLPGFLNVSAS